MRPLEHTKFCPFEESVVPLETKCGSFWSVQWRYTVVLSIKDSFLLVSTRYIDCTCWQVLRSECRVYRQCLCTFSRHYWHRLCWWQNILHLHCILDIAGEEERRKREKGGGRGGELRWGEREERSKRTLTIYWLFPTYIAVLTAGFAERSAGVVQIIIFASIRTLYLCFKPGRAEK